MSSTTLYGGEVDVVFNPDSRFRYVVTDPVMGLKDARIRGVTTVLGDVLDKPGLRLWARDEMAKVVFGMTLDNGKPIYHKKTALLKPGTSYTEPELQKVLGYSFNTYQIKTERGKDIGTMTHDFVAQYLINGTLPTKELVLEAYKEAPDEFIKCVLLAVEGFIGWWSLIIDKEVLGVENIIYSRDYKFSGTYDLKVKINGKIYMLDIKTTNRSPHAPLGIYPEYFMQLGGYMLADMESEKNFTFDDCGIINVGKDGKVVIVTASDLGLTTAECMDKFVKAVQIHDWLDKTSKLTTDSHFMSNLSKPNSEVEELIKSKVNEAFKEVA